MRMHNRQLKATYWNDPDLLQWPREKRWFYAGLIQLADDSGCLENSPFAFKLNIFSSPMDSDITLERLNTWRDELIQDKKIVCYTVKGKNCLYLKNFHKHQKLKNPSTPDVPLPPWIAWIPSNSNPRAGKYGIDENILGDYLQFSDGIITDDLKSSYTFLTNVFQPEPEPEPEPEDITTTANTAAHAHENTVISTENQGDSQQEGIALCFQKAIEHAELCFGRQLEWAERTNISNFLHNLTKKGSTVEDSLAIVSEALNRCIEPRNKNLRYLKKILNDWLAEGVTSLEDIADLDKKFSEQKSIMRMRASPDKNNRTTKKAKLSAHDDKYEKFYL